MFDTIEYWSVSETDNAFISDNFSFLTQSSNQILNKNDDGTIYGIRYVITPKPATLRPVKSWDVIIDEWVCDESANVSVQDILKLSLYNAVNGDRKSPIITDITLYDDKIKNIADKGFNALMASMVFTSKINAGRMPDIQKILSLYNLTD